MLLPRFNSGVTIIALGHAGKLSLHLVYDATIILRESTQRRYAEARLIPTLATRRRLRRPTGNLCRCSSPPAHPRLVLNAASRNRPTQRGTSNLSIKHGSKGRPMIQPNNGGESRPISSETLYACPFQICAAGCLPQAVPACHFCPLRRVGRPQRPAGDGWAAHRQAKRVTNGGFLQNTA